MKPWAVLVVEDDPPLRQIIRQFLRKNGYRVHEAADGDTALAELKRHPVDILITDLMMRPMDGLALMERARAEGFDGPVIYITANHDVGMAVEAMRRGAFDYVVKPLSMSALLETVVRAAQYIERQDAAGRRTPSPGDVIAVSPAMRRTVETARRVAMTHAPILISGEPGTGKSRLARLIHQESARSGGPWMVVDARETSVDWAAILGDPHTGIGRRSAPRGTLYIREIGLMPISAQERLANGLAILARNPALAAESARVVASTSLSLAARVQEGLFSPELYHRLSLVPIHVPPFRERAEDLGLLVMAMLSELSPDRPVTIDPRAMAILETLRWPGNGIELENVLRAALDRARGGRITPDDLPDTVRHAGAGPGPRMRHSEGLRGLSFAAFLRHREQQVIRFLMDQFGGDKRRVAQLLGLRERDLERKLIEGNGENER